MRQSLREHMLGAKWVGVYISPERGGQLDLNNQRIATQRTENLGNQDDTFRTRIAKEFKEFERLILLADKSNGNTDFYNDALIPISDLLGNLSVSFSQAGQIKLSRDGKDFELTDAKPPSQNRNNAALFASLSSGELEILSLGIFILRYSLFEQNEHQANFLLIDSPDAHMHPDMQRKFRNFVFKLAQKYDFQVVIATHSTAMVDVSSGDRVAFMPRDFRESSTRILKFNNPSEGFDVLVPAFGVHPLSQTFNQQPILLVEGEDDLRVWDQARRTSQNLFKVHPVEAGNDKAVKRYSKLLNELLPALYDDPKAYSIIDGDKKIGEPVDELEFVSLSRLNCYAIENLLLCDEVLKEFGLDWEAMKKKIQNWIDNNPDHSKHDTMQEFVDTDFDRRSHKIKDIRLILLMLLDTNKSWEVVVGQAIGRNVSSLSDVPDSIGHYLGERLRLDLAELIT